MQATPGDRRRKAGPTSTRERVERALRVAPLFVLSAIVTAAVANRALRRPSLETASDGVVHVTSSPERYTAKRGLDAPLVAPPVEPVAASNTKAAPDASVSFGAPLMLHGGPRHLHRSSARGPRTVNVGWRAQLGAPIAAQVVASPDARTLYAATLGGSLVAIARDTGARRWEVALGDRVYSTPLVRDDGTIYVGSDAKRFAAISPSGAVLWRLEVTGEADTAPALAKDGNVVFAAGDAVYSVRRGGDVAWRFQAKSKVFTAPAMTDDGLVVVGSQDDRVYAISPQGALVWSTNLGADVDGAAVIADDGAIYVGTDKGEVVRLGAGGEIVWTAPVGGFVRGAPSLAANGDVLVGTYGPVPRVVRLAPNGEIRGAFSIRGTGAREFGIHGGPLEDADGTLYFGAQDDAAYAIDRKGEVRWRFETGGDVDAPITMLDDGSIVIASEEGTLTMLLP